MLCQLQHFGDAIAREGHASAKSCEANAGQLASD